MCGIKKQRRIWLGSWKQWLRKPNSHLPSASWQYKQHAANKCYCLLKYNLTYKSMPKINVFACRRDIKHMLLGSSLLALLCIQEASLVVPIDVAGSRFSVGATHLCGFPIGHTCATLPHQPRRSLVGGQDSYLAADNEGLVAWALFFPLSSWVFLCLPLCISVSFTLLWSFSVCRSIFCAFFERVCFFAHLVDMKGLFFTCKLWRVWILNTQP